MSAHTDRAARLLKVIIVALLIGVVASLFSGLVFLFKDTDRQDSRRTLYALGVRITLAAALLLTVFYGLYTGQLRMGANAPWHDRTRNEAPAAHREAPAAHREAPAAHREEPAAHTEKPAAAPEPAPSHPGAPR